MNFQFDVNLKILKYSCNIIKNSQLISSYPISKKILQEISTDDFFSFSRSLGIEIPRSEVKNYVLGINKIENTFECNALSSYRSVWEILNSSVFDKSFSISLILKINAVLSEKIFEVWESGKIRNDSFPVKSDYDFFEVKDEIPSNMVLDSLNKISDFAENKDIPTLISSIVIAFNLLYLKPFSVFNDFTTIVILKSLLMDVGIFKDIPIFEIFYNNFDNFNNSNLNEWIEGFLYGLDKVLEDIYNTISRGKISANMKINTDSTLATLTPRQKEAFLYLLEHKVISREGYTKLFHVSPMTAFRDLRSMKEAGIITPFGRGKGLKYTIYEKYTL